MLGNCRSRILFATFVAFLIVGLAIIYILVRDRQRFGFELGLGSNTNETSDGTGEPEEGGADTPSTLIGVITRTKHGRTTEAPATTVQVIYVEEPTADSVEISSTASEDYAESTEPPEPETTPESTPEPEPTEARSTPSPMEEITMPTHNQHVPYCSFPHSYTPICAAPRLNPHPDEPEQRLSTKLRPVETALNLTMASRDGVELLGSVDIHVEILKESSTLVLHAGRHLKLELHELQVWDCTTEEALCVESVGQRLDFVSLGLSRSLKAGSSVRIRFPRYRSELAGNVGLVVQQPSQWEKDRAWMVGSLFGPHGLNNGSSTGLRQVVPNVDETEAKGVLKLCLTHPKDTQARSNSPVSQRQEEPESVSTCFEETPLIGVQQFAFVLFDNLKQISGEEPGDGDAEVEVFVGKHLKAEDCKWIVDEAQKVR